MKPGKLRKELEKALSKRDNKLVRALLEFWDDLEKLAEEETMRPKLHWLDGEVFPEVYFAYTLLLSGEDDPAVFGNETNPQELLQEYLEQGQSLRLAFYETVQKMVKEKYRRQHVYKI